MHAPHAASWPQAACHTVTAVVGAGVLGLPYAFSYLGWAGGTIFLTITLTSSLYTSWQLAGMHEQDGIRINRYRDLGVYTLGKKWGRLAIAPFQMLVMVRSRLPALARPAAPAQKAPASRCACSSRHADSSSRHDRGCRSQ